MIKINGLRINIINKKGIYGNEILFDNGLNIIRGNNSSGKSTVFQCLLYGLGMEELIGGKNTSALQYVLKEKITIEGKNYPVIESNVLLEIENKSGEKITVQRFIESEQFDPRYVKVYKGPLISESINSNIDFSEMYLHDPNSAKNEEYGFHAYLEKFLKIELPDVNYTDGSERKLYLQAMFPSFTIEQKNGWSDFLATIPYYKIREPKSKVIEFILGLNVLENQKKKTKLNFSKKIIEYQWEQKYLELNSVLKGESFEVLGVNISPFIIKPEDKIYVRRLTEEGYKEIDEYLHLLRIDLENMNAKIPKSGQVAKELSLKSDKVTRKLSIATIEKQEINNEIELIRREIKEYKRDYSNTIKELENYNAYKKVKVFAKEANLTLTTDNCPTCNQHIKDTLLPQYIAQDYMKLDENIEHLKAQKQMYIKFIAGQEDSLINKQKKLERIIEFIKSKRLTLKSINRDLIADDRLPSQYEIEKRIRLENQIRHYSKLRITISQIISEFKKYSKEYSIIQGKLKDLPSNFYSANDIKKMHFFNQQFKNLLKEFNYRSYEIDDISIPYDGYFPTVKGLNLVKNTTDKQTNFKKGEGKLKHNSSASDFVRAIWAYTCSLYKTSLNFQGNHPKLLIFDEPSQHDMANSDMNNFLKQLSTYKNGQSIVFASFGERDDIFKEETKGLEDFKLIDFSTLRKIFVFQNEI